MSTGLVKQDQQRARRKGLAAAGAMGATVAVFSASTLLGVVGLAVTGYLAYDWFMFRARRGMRF